MSIAYPAQPLAARQPGRVFVLIQAWLTTRRQRRLQRRTEREVAELPPHLLRDIGLVDLAQAREASGGRTLDHTRAPCTALSSWTW